MKMFSHNGDTAQRLRALGFVIPSHDLPVPEPPSPRANNTKFHIVSRFATPDSVILSIVFTVVGGLIMGGYVWIRYDENYFFSDYERNEATKNVADAYVDFGDTLMLSYGYRAAVAHYQRALELDATNQRAIEGMLKAQAMLPEEGEALYNYDIALAKVDHLIARYRTDPEVHTMRGLLMMWLGNIHQAVISFKTGIVFDQMIDGYVNYPGNHLGLTLAHLSIDPKQAVQYGEEAIDINRTGSIDYCAQSKALVEDLATHSNGIRSEDIARDSTTVINGIDPKTLVGNISDTCGRERTGEDKDLARKLAYPLIVLGQAQLATGNWEAARNSFDEALDLKPDFLTQHLVALAMRQSGHINEALQAQKVALDMALLVPLDKAAEDPGSNVVWTFYHLPVGPDDGVTVGQKTQFGSPTLKVAFFQYEYGIDAALTGDIDTANHYFQLAGNNDANGNLNALVTNHLLSAYHFVQPSEDVSRWINEQVIRLSGRGSDMTT